MHNNNDYEPIAYLVARLMHCLNMYGQNYHNYCNENKIEFFKGVKMAYSNLIPYERAKGKIIILSGFTFASQDESLAIKLSGRDNTQSLYKTNLKFSAVFIIRNLYNKNWISNGIGIN